MQYVARNIENLNWITIILVSCLVIIAGLKVFYPKRFEDFIKLPFSNNYFLKKGKSEELRHPFSIVLFLIQIVSISLFIFLFFINTEKNNTLLFLQILSGVFVFISIKYSIEKIIGIIFNLENEINKYLYEKLSYRNFLSIIVILVNFIFYYSFKPSLVTLTVFSGIFVALNVLILFYSYKKYRSLIFSNFFYFLLYLCALEISPYFILYKALI